MQRSVTIAVYGPRTVTVTVFCSQLINALNPTYTYSLSINAMGIFPLAAMDDTIAPQLRISTLISSLRRCLDCVHQLTCSTRAAPDIDTLTHNADLEPFRAGEADLFNIRLRQWQHVLGSSEAPTTMRDKLVAWSAPEKKKHKDS